MTRTDNKITLVNIKLNLNACRNLCKKELSNLSNTACDFLNFIQSFGHKLRLRDFVNIWMVEDRVDDLDSVTCGIFQIYFYNSLFNPDQNSKIQNKNKLNKKTIETLLNKLFILGNQEQNEMAINNYTNDRDITIT